MRTYRHVGLLLVLLLLWPIAATAQMPRTTRVSVATGGVQAGGGGGPFSIPAISADGRYVAFDSGASDLVPGDTNNWRDVFVHDRQTGTTTRVSVATDGTQANGVWDGSYAPALSADGRYVAFVSDATTLVPGSTFGRYGVFVHDRDARTTTRVSVASDGTDANDNSHEPVAISADGRYVAFTSVASNLVSGDTNGGGVFVHDCWTETTTRVSVATGGVAGNGASGSPAISADGRYIAFVSAANNLVPDDTNGDYDVFVHDQKDVITTRVSVATGGIQASGGGLLAIWTSPVVATSISADGRYVAFASSAADLVPDDTNGVQDVFVHDRHTLTTTRVNVATGGIQTTGGEFTGIGAVLSADGRYVAFNSIASDLVSGDTNATGDVFVHDRQTGTTTRVSVATDGTQGVGDSAGPFALSAHGRHVVFSSVADNLVPNDTNGCDVFVRDRGSWPGDYDGSRITDPTMFRSSNGIWYQLHGHSASATGLRWGFADDRPVPADYDGDGTTDVAVFRPAEGTWYIVPSTTSAGVAVTWGLVADVPVPADYDGDGKTDVAVYRPSTSEWYIIRSTTNRAVKIAWGIKDDVPVPADFDGDGKADPTVFRPSTGTWYELRSTTGEGFGVLWGQAGDVPLAADYDGDGKADPTVFRASAGTWYELRSTTGVGFGVIWGTTNDVPIVGDYDGDGKADPTVYRPATNTWYQWRSTTGGFGFIWGVAGDLPL